MVLRSSVGMRANKTLPIVGLIVGLFLCAEFAAGAETESIPVATPNAVASGHPLDPLLKIAEDGLDRMKREVQDYSAILVRRERLKGVLGDYTFLEAKIRNQKIEEEQVVTPFAVWLKFLKPADLKDREVMWVEGENNGKMWVQESPILGFKVPAVWIVPDGALAMADNKYPISDIGIINLLEKLIAKGKADRDRNHPEECEVKSVKGAKIDGRLCTMHTIKHLKERPEYEFYLAEIFIDDELQVPIRYVAYRFPTDEKSAPPIEEEYTYTRLKLNPGFSAETFQR